MPSKVSQQPRLRSTRSQTRLPNAQEGIQNFARLSKPGANATYVKENAKELSVTTSTTKKRKLDESEDRKSDHEDTNETTASKLPKARRLDQPVAAPPSKAAQLEKKSLSPSPSPSRSSSVDIPDPAEDTLSSSSPSIPASTDDYTPRTTSFDDLLSLHSSFLSALSIHYAHNGSSVAADLGTLCLHTEKIWKKRKVTVKDIQRIVHVLGISTQEDEDATFRVADYGNGKTCLEMLDAKDAARFSMPFDEARLLEIFSQSLNRLWEEHDGKGEFSNPDFAESIPLAPIHKSASKFNPLRKGQLRLQDLKAGVVVVKAERESRARARALQQSTLKKDAKATTGRRVGLLERIKNKESEQAKLPPPPTKDTLLRRAAAQRVEDVAGVLLQLRPSASSEMEHSDSVPLRRKPYKLANVIRNVQDSSANPISDQEVEMCLDIIAQPSVAGDWVSIIAIGKLKSVVLKSGQNASPRDIAMKAAEQEGV